MKYIFTLFLLILSIISFAGEYLFTDFQDTDLSMFKKAGDSHFLDSYAINISNDSSYCMELSMNEHKGWFGVQFPEFAKLPVKNINTIEFDCKTISNCPEIQVTLFLKDNSRWQCVIGLTDQWKNVKLTQGSFFPEENPNKLPKIDLTQISYGWISLRPTQNWEGNIAQVLIDNLKFYGDVDKSAMSQELEINKLTNLKGVKVCVIDTNVYPLYGQSENAVENIYKYAKKAGASVFICKDISKLNLTNTVIVYESPVTNQKDFNVIENLLKKGNRLVCLGVDFPFSRVINGNSLTKQEQNYDSNFRKLTKAQYLTIPNENKFKLTEFGEKILKEFPKEIDSVKGNMLPIDDSVYLHQNYPWVDFNSLMKVDYRQNNWVFLDRPFQGSVISEFVHYAGKYAGSVMIFSSLSTGKNSILNPNGGSYGYLITSLIKEASKQVKIDKKIDKVQGIPFVVTRDNFFHNNEKIMGGLNFNSTDLSNEDNIYAIRRMGYNTLLIGIPWTLDKNKEGYYIDFDKTDKIIKEANNLKLGIIFDPYCFGWEKFPWANVHNGVTDPKASIFNKTFMKEFARNLEGLVNRYKDAPSLVAVYATPDTGYTCFKYPGDSPLTQELWNEYAKKHNLSTTLPTNSKEKGKYATSPENEAYVDFWYENMDEFLTLAVETIRKVCPNMPILLRGAYLDAATEFRFCQKYKDMGPYCECMETSNDVEAYFRGLSITYDTTIGGENGWPKERGLPLRMSMADTLLGGYKYYLFSFEAVPYAQPGTLEFERLSKVWGNVINADRINGNTAMLISDSTIWTSNTGNFFEIEGRPNSGYILEKLGIGFGAVSCHYMDNIDKYKVIVDNGCNNVFTKKSREKLINWIKEGGSFVCYTFTGNLDMSGTSDTLEKDLGISFTPGEYNIGKGKVIILDKVFTEDKDFEEFKNVLVKAGSQVTVGQDTAVSSTAYKKDNNIYYVFYNKSKTLISSFFSEERRPAADASLQDTQINIDLPQGKTKAIELMTGKELKIINGKIAYTLPAGDYALIKFF